MPFKMPEGCTDEDFVDYFAWSMEWMKQFRDDPRPVAEKFAEMRRERKALLARVRRARRRNSNSGTASLHPAV
jgi:hypothetical protein